MILFSLVFIILLAIGFVVLFIRLAMDFWEAFQEEDRFMIIWTVIPMFLVALTLGLVIICIFMLWSLI